MSITKAELTEVVKELFNALDNDKSTFLEKDEVKQIAEQLHGKMSKDEAFNESAFQEAFVKLDKNGDGKIAFDELNDWFHKAAEKRGLLKDE